jgi:hypothetical protein
MDQELREHLEAMEQRMLHQTQEMVRDAQTEILRGFDHYHYQTGVQLRLRTLEAETSNLKTAQELRLANLEERVIALEIAIQRKRLSNGGEAH